MSQKLFISNGTIDEIKNARDTNVDYFASEENMKFLFNQTLYIVKRDGLTTDIKNARATIINYMIQFAREKVEPVTLENYGKVVVRQLDHMNRFYLKNYLMNFNTLIKCKEPRFGNKNLDDMMPEEWGQMDVHTEEKAFEFNLFDVFSKRKQGGMSRAHRHTRRWDEDISETLGNFIELTDTPKSRGLRMEPIHDGKWYTQMKSVPDPDGLPVL